jgi:hypothetical protein
MIAYEVLRDCSISYTETGSDKGFVLYKGDYFFIEPDFAWVKKESRLKHESPYTKRDLLKSIYHNKLVWFGDNPEDTKYEWTWIKNINIIDPKIENSFAQFNISNCDKVNSLFGAPFIKDVTQQWEREIKLNEIISI